MIIYLSRNINNNKMAELEIIDCHCHLAAAEFKEDIDTQILEAKKVGVSKLVVVAEFPADFQPILELAKGYPDFVCPALGVHPVQEGDRSVTYEDFKEAEKWIRSCHSELIAVGEIGLDFTPRYIKTNEDKNVQRHCFAKQIQLGKEFDLPLNVHSRSAGRPVIDILIQEGARNVILHAFDGKVSNALRGVEAGFFFSVPPCIARSEQKKKLVQAIPLDHLLLETDAPALGPEKNCRNELRNIQISCEEIAKIKELSVDEVKRQTTKNARKLLKL